MTTAIIRILYVTVGFATLYSVNASICGSNEWEDHPALCSALDFSEQDEAGFLSIVHDWASRHMVLVDLRPSEVATSIRRKAAERNKSELPVVFAHGMGDSCFNSGMQRIASHTSDLLGGVYSTCIPTGDTQAEDTKNGYFLNMDASVDVFASKVKEDPALKNGFSAIGFSQGNNVIRGYIARFNDPPVHTFISVNGVNAGIGAVPYCRPSDESMVFGAYSMCDLLMEQASRSAYTEFAQQHSFQANYWRDPRPEAAERYHKYCQLAIWNNEVESRFNQTLIDNWSKTERFVWIEATDDGMVWPKEGEHWGAPDPSDPFQHILPMNETEWYEKDLFGLRAAQEAGKNVFESFAGDHLQFTMEDFDRWVTAYM